MNLGWIFEPQLTGSLNSSRHDSNNASLRTTFTSNSHDCKHTWIASVWMAVYTYLMCLEKGRALSNYAQQHQLLSWVRFNQSDQEQENQQANWIITKASRGKSENIYNIKKSRSLLFVKWNKLSWCNWRSSSYSNISRSWRFCFQTNSHQQWSRLLVNPAASQSKVYSSHSSYISQDAVHHIS